MPESMSPKDPKFVSTEQVFDTILAQSEANKLRRNAVIRHRLRTFGLVSLTTTGALLIGISPVGTASADQQNALNQTKSEPTSSMTVDTLQIGSSGCLLPEAVANVNGTVVARPSSTVFPPGDVSRARIQVIEDQYGTTIVAPTELPIREKLPWPEDEKTVVTFVTKDNTDCNPKKNNSKKHRN